MIHKQSKIKGTINKRRLKKAVHLITNQSTILNLAETFIPNKVEEKDYTKRIINEKIVLNYIKMEQSKKVFGETIDEEYIEKVIMFGFIVVSG